MTERAQSTLSVISSEESPRFSGPKATSSLTVSPQSGCPHPEDHAYKTPDSPEA